MAFATANLAAKKNGGLTVCSQGQGLLAARNRHPLTFDKGLILDEVLGLKGD